MIEMGCCPERRLLTPIQPSQPNVRLQICTLISSHLQIAGEDREVDAVKSDNCRIESDIGLSDMITKQIWVVLAIRQMLFHSIKGLYSGSAWR